MQRQGDLSLRRGDSTAHSRMDAINKETITQYFSLLKDVLDACDLVDNPGLIYNVDESGVYHSTLRSTLRPRMWWPREVQRKCDIYRTSSTHERDRYQCLLYMLYKL